MKMRKNIIHLAVQARMQKQTSPPPKKTKVAKDLHTPMTTKMETIMKVKLTKRKSKQNQTFTNNSFLRFGRSMIKHLALLTNTKAIRC